MGKKYPDRLISVTIPAVPLWAIYFVAGAPDELLALPVMALAVVEEKAGDPDSRVIRPLSYDPDNGVNDWWESGGALGYLLENDVSRAKEIFAAAIAREKRRSDSCTKTGKVV
jgi:hypothetical protein